jgi:hypothetical protein
MKNGAKDKKMADNYEKYSDLWILHLAASTQGIVINPYQYRKGKWWKSLWRLSTEGLLRKKRHSGSSFTFSLTDLGKEKICLNNPSASAQASPIDDTTKAH